MMPQLSCWDITLDLCYRLLSTEFLEKPDKQRKQELNEQQNCTPVFKERTESQ